MKLKEIMDNKNYTEFFEDEKELLWKLRAEVRDHYPESLSKLLLITKWNKREDVLQVEIEKRSLLRSIFTFTVLSMESDLKMLAMHLK